MTQNSSYTQIKFYGLDHLRALAILLVFFYHYQIITHGEPEWLPDAAKFGWTGVDLFFVLSGFLISSQLFSQVANAQKISFKEFFLKRFFRIIPAYWVVLVIYFCIPFFREKEALPPLWKFLTFTQNLGLNLRGFGTFSHAWSLCVEEHFYFFLPIILIILQSLKIIRKSYWIIIALFLVGFICRVYSYDHLYFPLIEEKGSWVYWYKYIYYPTYNRLDGLLVGISIAAMYQFLPNIWSRIAKYGNLFFIISLVILTGAYFLCEEEHSYGASIFGFPLVALGYGCMVISAISPTCFLYKWNSKATTFIATISYAIYLTHKGIIHMTNELLADANMDKNIILLISVVTSICGAIILHLLVEMPFMRLRHKIIKK